MRRITPICPKCKQQNTYDLIPALPNTPEFQRLENISQEIFEYTIGNAKYYCLDCDYTWKKYRGKKPYDRIKVIHANVGGYPGPYYQVKIDLESKAVERKALEIEDEPVNRDSSNHLTLEEIDWFRTELYKCDFVNWAEEYFMMAMDGTHWSVRIEFDTHCEIKTGSNHFPPKWSKFCKAVAQVSKGQFH